MPANRPSLFKRHFEEQRAIKRQQQQLAERRRPTRAAQRRLDQATQSEHALDETVADRGTPAGNIELRFYADTQRLKEIQSIDSRIALKAEMLPHYLGWIDGVLAVSNPIQNDMLMHLMVWTIDVGDYELALRIAEYAMLNGYVMPEPYKRSVASILAEQISDGLLQDLDGMHEHLDLIERTVELTLPEDMVDQIRAKLLKCLGLALAQARPKEALAALESAKRLHKSVGVTPQINKLRRQINSQATLDDEADDTESSRDAPSGSQDTSGTPGAPAADPASTAPSVNTGI